MDGGASLALRAHRKDAAQYDPLRSADECVNLLAIDRRTHLSLETGTPRQAVVQVVSPPGDWIPYQEQLRCKAPP